MLLTKDAFVALAFKTRPTGRICSILILELLACFPDLLFHREALIVLTAHASIALGVYYILYAPTHFASSCIPTDSLAFLTEVTVHCFLTVFCSVARLISSCYFSRFCFTYDGCEENKFSQALHLILFQII